MTVPTFMGRTPNFTARIADARRLKSSVNGNPRFVVTFDNGDALTTQSDSSVSYDVENFSRHDVSQNPEVAVWLSRAGRIEAITRLI